MYVMHGNIHNIIYNNVYSILACLHLGVDVFLFQFRPAVLDKVC